VDTVSSGSGGALPSAGYVDTTIGSPASFSGSSLSAGGGDGSLPGEILATKEEEDRLRGFFAQEGELGSLDVAVRDKHALLLNVYAEPGKFQVAALTAQEAVIPEVLAGPKADRKQGESAIVSEAEFMGRWQEFTNGSLASIDWNNVFVAGGAVLKCLLRDSPTDDRKSESKGSDIDLFLYGLSDEAANAKVRDIYDRIFPGSSKKEMVRTKNAITMIFGFPTRHVQVILRMYRSPAEVLMGFDIDSCTVGYDGANVWALPRAHRAITRGYNLVDLSRRSLTYELRLHKYSKRGFAVRIPGYRPQEVDVNLYQDTRAVKDVTGLARLLLLEHRAGATAAARSKGFREDPFSHDRALEQALAADPGTSAHDEDYIMIFIPWGPRWSIQSTFRLLNMRDMSQYFANLAKDPHFHSHICLTGSAAAFDGRASWCKSCMAGRTPATAEGKDFVGGPITWLRKNPGSQGKGVLDGLLTGSFHPLSADDWTRDAYRDYGGQRGVQPAPYVSSAMKKGPRTVLPWGGVATKTVATKKVATKKAAAVKKAPKKKLATKKTPKSHVRKVAPAKKVTKSKTAPRAPLFMPGTFGATPGQTTGPFAQAALGAGFAGQPLQSTGGFGQPTGGFSQPVAVGQPVGGFGQPGPPPAGGFGQAAGGFGQATAPSVLGQALPSVAAPAGAPKSGGRTVDDINFQSATADFEEVFDNVAPKTPYAKLLLLVSMLFKGGKVTAHERTALKNLIISNDENVLCALEVFEMERDWDDLADSFRQITQLSKTPQ